MTSRVWAFSSRQGCKAFFLRIATAFRHLHRKSSKGCPIHLPDKPSSKVPYPEAPRCCSARHGASHQKTQTDIAGSVNHFVGLEKFPKGEKTDSAFIFLPDDIEDAIQVASDSELGSTQDPPVSKRGKLQKRLTEVTCAGNGFIAGARLRYQAIAMGICQVALTSLNQAGAQKYRSESNSP